MVASERTDIFSDVTHLLEKPPMVHWQLNVVWVRENFYRDFFGWIDVYKAGIRDLVEYWIERMKDGS